MPSDSLLTRCGRNTNRTFQDNSHRDIFTPSLNLLWIFYSLNSSIWYEMAYAGKWMDTNLVLTFYYDR